MIGGTIGTYRMAELLGDGGLGPVYRGVDQATGREAAFRVFSQEVSRDPMLADRLRAMSPVLKRLQHANIGAVYDLIAVGADLAMFLEFVPGAPLDQVRRQTGQLDVNVAVSCAVQVLRALEFANGVGVLHHALRPANIMVTPQGTVKVMDFGIGHAFGANRKTREDRLLNVLAYLAPEQIQNQPGDARSDIYSVGVVLYELLTGRLPFDHKTEFALRQSHLHEPPAPPRAYVPALPEWLDRAVMRALAKSPGARFQNATECRAVLEAALGLSTSKAAAVVRGAGGTTAAIFEAAPPLPPAATPPGEEPTRYVTPATPPAPPAPPPVAVAPPVAVPPPAPVVPPVRPRPEPEATVVMRVQEPPPPLPAPPPPISPAPFAPAAPPAHADATAVVRPVKASEMPTSPLAAPDLDALTAPAPAAPIPAAVPAADIPVSEPPAAPPVVEAPAPPAAEGSPIGTKAVAPVPAAPAAKAAAKPPAASGKRSSMTLVIAALAVLLVVGGGTAAFFWMRGQTPPEATEEGVPPPSADAPADTTVPPEAAPGAAALPDAPPPAAGAIPPPAGEVPPSGAALPAAPPPAAAPSRRPASKPKPAEAAPPPAPVVTPAEPPAAAPPVETPPPPPKPPAHVVNLPDVSFRKVKLITQSGTTEKSTDVVLMFLPDRMTVTPTSGGTTIRSLRYREMSGLTYAKEEKKRLGLIKTAQHVLTIDTRAEPMVLRLDKDNVEAVLSALEARTGKSVGR